MKSSSSSPSLAQLKRAVAIKEQIAKLEQELAGLLQNTSAPAAAAPRRRKISAAGLARIKAAQKARWAKIKAAQKSGKA